MNISRRTIVADNYSLSISSIFQGSFLGSISVETLLSQTPKPRNHGAMVLGNYYFVISLTIESN